MMTCNPRPVSRIAQGVFCLSLLVMGSSLAHAQQDDLGTTVVGSQEAPTVLNVVPWKDREVEIERTDPTTSLLDRMLEPLDPDVLQREIEYHDLQAIPVRQ